MKIYFNDVYNMLAGISRIKYTAAKITRRDTEICWKFPTDKRGDCCVSSRRPWCLPMWHKVEVWLWKCSSWSWKCSSWSSLPMSIRFSVHSTHWGRVTHICVSKLTTIGSDNGLSPERRQANIWTNAGILLIGTLGTHFSEILSEIQTLSFMKMLLKTSSAKRRPFCLGKISRGAPLEVQNGTQQDLNKMIALVN